MRALTFAFLVASTITANAGEFDRERAICERHTIRVLRLPDGTLPTSRYEPAFADLCKALDDKERAAYEAASGATTPADLDALKAAAGQ